MPKALTILKEDPRFSSTLLDFELLRKEGIDYVAALSGDLWTDYNLHDPGITILEVLCYALIDLGYRNQLPIEELLAIKPSTTPTPVDDNFFTPAQILTCNPLTILDYRKMLLDIDGVRNAWLEPTDEAEVDLFINCNTDELEFEENEDNKPLILNGLYKVLLELDAHFPGENSDECFDSNAVFDRIYQEVRSKLHGHRNLCEDFVDIKVLQKEQLGICADLELNAAADHEDTLVEIYENIQEFLSPTLQFYTLQELLDKKIPIEEIYEGRPVSSTSKGFILTEELAALHRKREIHASDLYRVILQDERVKSVKNLTLFNFLGGTRQTTGEDWYLQLTEGYHPVFSPELSNFKFFKGVIPFKANQKRVLEKFSKRIANISKVEIENEYDLDKPIPYGQYRDDLGEYVSIQHEFPLVYGIGEGHLAKSVSTKRQAQALQLKGYLLFFDQMLANYGMQMANVRNLFSLQPESQKDIETQQTYFSQSPDDVPQIEQLLHFYKKNKPTDKPQNGETIALFSLDATVSAPETAAERDAFIQEIQRLYASEQAKIETFLANDDPGNLRYAYRIKDTRNRQLLVSKKDWEDTKRAKKQAELLDFLIPLENSFRKINNQQQGKYSFEIQYQPQLYFDYLKEITENRTQFLQRRDGFLNHLLARFAEDFNDYVLLNFGVNQGTPNLEDVVEDKGQFLSQYPEISRGRGTGIDCQDEAKIWNSDNITGLEKRVTSLMGIPDWQRKNLSNFGVVERTDLFGFEYRDHRGNLLFENAIEYATKAKAKEAMDNFYNLASNESNYGCFDYAANCAFGIQILDGQTVLATHPITYPTAEKRDAVKACLATMVASDGLMTGIRQTASGFRVQVRNKDGSDLLKSTSIFDTETEAWEDWLVILAATEDADNFQVKPAKIGDGYSFELQTWEDGKVTILATHPKVYSTKPVATQRKNEAIAYFKNNGLPFEITQEATKYGWNLRNNCGDILLTGYQEIASKTEGEIDSVFHFFKNKTQAKSLILNILDLVLNKKETWQTDEENGQFYFYLLQDETLCIAQSAAFASAAARDEAYLEVYKYLKELAAKLEKWLPESFAFQFQIVGQKTGLTLQGTQFFRKKKDTKIAFQNAQNQARNSANWSIERIENCCYQVQLLDSCREAIAKSELFDTYEDARDFYADMKSEARAKTWEMKGQEHDLKYGFSIFENFPASGNLLLKSHQLYATKLEALCAYFETLTQSKDAANFQKTKCKKRGHQFILENGGGEILAVSDAGFKSKKKRDFAISELVEKLQEIVPFLDITELTGRWSYALLDENGEAVLVGEEYYESHGRALRAYFQMLEVAEKAGNFKEKTEEGSCRFGFDLYDEEEVIAVHPKWYFPKEEMSAALKNLVTYIQENHYNLAVEKEEGKWLFELDWMGCSGACEVVLQSREFDEKNEATDVLESFRSISETPDKYHLTKKEIDGRYSIVLHLGQEKKPVATHPQGFFDERERDAVMTDLQAYLAFSNSEEKTVIHYFSNSISDGDIEHNLQNNRGFGYELQNNLLNSRFTFLTKKEAWEATKRLINFVQEADGIFRFTDFDKDCCRSFKAVSSSYRMAKHPRHYANPETREIARDWLANHAICLPYSTVCCGTIAYTTPGCAAIPDCNSDNLGENTTYFFTLTEKVDSVEKILWKSCESYETTTLAKAAYSEQFMQILTYARSIEYYRFKKNEFGQCEVQLQDETGKCLAVFPCAFNLEDAAARLEAILKRLQHALLFPVLATEEGYLFQVYDFEFDATNLATEAAILINQKAFDIGHCEKEETEIISETPDYESPILAPSDCGCDEQLYLIDQVKTLVTGAKIWEGCQTFDTANAAFCAFENFHKNILPNKANFQWEGSVCDPFELVVVDPAEVLATHPNCYETDVELETAIEETLASISVEGFHVLEHILLRPRQQNRQEEDGEIMKKNELLPSCPSPTVCDNKEEEACGKILTEEEAIFTEYLPGADPYSFWATVVLPYWPKRFLNNNFRLFLEETIRKEAPAHVGLHIAWVSPEQMEAFETAFRAWLEAKAQGRDSCDLNDTQQSLLAIVKALRNEFPESRLQSPCEDRSSFNPVYLGFSKLA